MEKVEETFNYSCESATSQNTLVRSVKMRSVVVSKRMVSDGENTVIDF